MNRSHYNNLLSLYDGKTNLLAGGQPFNALIADNHATNVTIVETLSQESAGPWKRWDSGRSNRSCN